MSATIRRTVMEANLASVRHSFCESSSHITYLRCTRLPLVLVIASRLCNWSRFLDKSQKSQRPLSISTCHFQRQIWDPQQIMLEVESNFQGRTTDGHREQYCRCCWQKG